MVAATAFGGPRAPTPSGARSSCRAPGARPGRVRVRGSIGGRGRGRSRGRGRGRDQVMNRIRVRVTADLDEVAHLLGQQVLVRVEGEG